MLPVVIATLERYHLLKQTLDSIKKNSVGKVYPIVIDDGSKDERVKKLLRNRAKKGEIHLVENPERMGVSYCRTIGVELADELEQTKEHEYIYFSDNDMYFEKGWDKELLQAAAESPKFGIIGGAKHPHHGVAGIEKWSGGIVRNSDQQVGFSMLIRKQLLKRVGGFVKDDSKSGAYGVEDTDLCNRFRRVGYMVGAIDPEVVVHCGIKHVEGTDTAGVEHIKIMRAERPELVFA